MFAYATQRPADITIAAIGAAAAKWIRGDAIAQTPARLAEFVAQTCNETGGFTRFEEDLRYSAATMLAQWPTHFTAAQAAACVGRPVEIACRAYGGRMGNAAPPAKDGWLYRGRGMLQQTGKAAYARFGQMVGLDLLGNPISPPIRRTASSSRASSGGSLGSTLRSTPTTSPRPASSPTAERSASPRSLQSARGCEKCWQVSVREVGRL
ncbi:hypothetical protein [Sphingomonas nostoxanthinifaciens]|uniref:hypothetical protein n=1 Tax=Sphingomonas nostoxanthinifaciens TaxID=2872652 RepID=UPI001CC20742|nr:hypothetical protein [Sphingomonas nostoxanthinifaciens]UAK25662.1 hypothetical protein K8P63_05820 [Sphingomonas nostoxanthinifaciens]